MGNESDREMTASHAPVIRMHDQGLGEDMNLGATAPCPLVATCLHALSIATKVVDLE